MVHDTCMNVDLIKFIFSREYTLDVYKMTSVVTEVCSDLYKT